MTTAPLTLGTRGSPLALVQTVLVRKAMVEGVPSLAGRIAVCTFVTRGDRDRANPIERLGGRGIFTDELDDAVAVGTIDLAVHSVKDLPVPLPRGLMLAATLRRGDPREAFVSTRHASLAAVPRRGVLGSASIRRERLIRALRPDVTFALLRGNVEERVAALDQRGLDGTILAVAGLKRLGLDRHIREILAPDALMPDPGQGAIGLVCRTDNFAARTLAARINHAPTFAEVAAERAFLAAAGGRFVVGALAVAAGATLSLSATAAAADGRVLWRGTATGSTQAAAALGLRLAAQVPQAHRQGQIA